MDTTGGPYKTEFVDGVFRSYHNHSKEDAPKYGARLRDAVTTPVNWPTASTRDHKDSPGMSLTGVNPDGTERKRTDQLARAVYASGLAARDNLNSVGSRQESWATPASGDWKGQSSSPSYKKVDLNDQMKTSGKLNPRWVETLMGLPVGWVMPSCTSPITPMGDASLGFRGGNWMTPDCSDRRSMNSKQQGLSNQVNWMTPEAILRLGSQVIQNSSAPVTIAPTSCDSSATELFQQPLNSPSELFGRN
jgi:hypothetical protein